MPMDSWPRMAEQRFDLTCGFVTCYRRDDRLVSGPCMSLYVGDVEVMRFDLPTRPAGKCHEHWYGLPGRPRLYYPAKWRHQQCAELALWNLVHSAAAACALVGVATVDRAELRAAAEWAERLLIGEPCES
jgi:hypothetical protein